MSTNRVIILADGQFPTAEYPLSILHSADCIVCCDNSVVKLIQHTSLLPHYIIGDMDSISDENKLRFNEIIHKFPDQETNDLTKAFNFALELNPSHIYILGATGHREDHTLGNISLLAQYAQSYPNTEIVTDYGIFTAHFNSCTIECKPGQQVSIFAFDPTLKIKSAGLVYPTDNVVFDLWYKATLNEAISDSFELTFNHPSAIIIYKAN